jgi:predicted PurR-regulated permease PerM
LHSTRRVLSLDDRTGNVLTTIGVFAAVVGVVILARATLVVFVLALLLAYLLEPAVSWVDHRLPSRSGSRAIAIAVVYLMATALLVAAGYAIEPALAGQIARLNAALPGMFARFGNPDFLARHGAAIAGVIEPAAEAVAGAAQNLGWLFLVPVIAVLFLMSRQELIDGAVDLFGQRGDRVGVRHTIEKIDGMLGQYTRAQSATAGLSAIFYITSMTLLRFPYPLALGALGGVLDFVPVVGWILAAAAILASGWLAHAHWIWMALVLAIWRVALNVAISPRILGDRLQLEPITVFFALMAGGEIAGLPGIVLAVPAVAVLRIVWFERASRRDRAAA